MTIQEFLLWASPVLVPLVGGLVGTGLEKLGTKFQIAALVGIGQRVEALFADVPKLIRGSRATKLQAEIELLKGEGPKTPRSVPPIAPAAALLLIAGALALNETACASNIPPPKPGCDDASAAQIAALCFARVKTECVDKGVPEAECGIIKACDEEADNRQKECLQ